MAVAFIERYFGPHGAADFPAGSVLSRTLRPSGLSGLSVQSVQSILITALLLTIGASAALASLNVPANVVPRGVFIAMAAISALLLGALVFGLVYFPLRDRNYPRLLPNAIVLLLFLFAAIRLSTSGFWTDDEIYSWNMWAIQHFQGQSASFMFTGAPYPQLFPYWLAALYQAMGGVAIQSAPRFFLSLPILLITLSTFTLARIGTWRAAVLVTLVLLLAFGPIAYRFTKAMADPLMSTAMIVSVMLLIAYARTPQKTALLWCAGTCALIAATTKQPGVIWACFSLPVIVAIGCWRDRWPKKALLPAAATFLAAAVWPLLIAPTFVKNAGVISASMAHRSYGAQFIFAVDKYLIGQPLITLLLFAAVLVSWRHAILRRILLLALLPMLLAWFIFGAYEIRLGIHVLAMGALLIVSGLCMRAQTAADGPGRPEHAGQPVANPVIASGRRAIAWSSVFTIVVFGAILSVTLKVAEVKKVDLYDGAQSTLRYQYGDASADVIARLFQENGRVWASTGYTYGPFFGRVPVTMPRSEETFDGVRQDLIAFRADYAVHGGIHKNGYTEALKVLAERCPKALVPVLLPPNQYDFTLYKVNQSELSQGSCK